MPITLQNFQQKAHEALQQRQGRLAMTQNAETGEQELTVVTVSLKERLFNFRALRASDQQVKAAYAQALKQAHGDDFIERLPGSVTRQLTREKTSARRAISAIVPEARQAIQDANRTLRLEMLGPRGSSYLQTPKMQSLFSAGLYAAPGQPPQPGAPDFARQPGDPELLDFQLDPMVSLNPGHQPGDADATVAHPLWGKVKQVFDNSSTRLTEAQATQAIRTLVQDHITARRPMLEALARNPGVDDPHYLALRALVLNADELDLATLNELVDKRHELVALLQPLANRATFRDGFQALCNEFAHQGRRAVSPENFGPGRLPALGSNHLLMRAGLSLLGEKDVSAIRQNFQNDPVADLMVSAVKQPDSLATVSGVSVHTLVLGSVNDGLNELAFWSDLYHDRGHTQPGERTRQAAETPLVDERTGNSLLTPYQRDMLRTHTGIDVPPPTGEAVLEANTQAADRILGEMNLDAFLREAAGPNASAEDLAFLVSQRNALRDGMRTAMLDLGRTRSGENFRILSPAIDSERALMQNAARAYVATALDRGVSRQATETIALAGYPQPLAVNGQWEGGRSARQNLERRFNQSIEEVRFTAQGQPAPHASRDYTPIRSAEDLRMVQFIKDLERNAQKFDGALSNVPLPVKYQKWDDFLAANYPAPAQKDNAMRDLAQIFHQGGGGDLMEAGFAPNQFGKLQGDQNSARSAHRRQVALGQAQGDFQAQPIAVREDLCPWSLLSIDGANGEFRIEPDPQRPEAMLVSVTWDGPSYVITTGTDKRGEQSIFGNPNSTPAHFKGGVTLRYVPSAQPNTPGRVEVLGAKSDYAFA